MLVFGLTWTSCWLLTFPVGLGPGCFGVSYQLVLPNSSAILCLQAGTPELAIDPNGQKEMALRGELRCRMQGQIFRFKRSSTCKFEALFDVGNLRLGVAYLASGLELMGVSSRHSEILSFEALKRARVTEQDKEGCIPWGQEL